MNEKKEIVKEIFSPVIKKFQRIQIQTHDKDECWSIDLIDRSSLSKYNKNYKFIFTIIDNHTKSKKNQEKVQQLHLKVLLKKEKENIWSDRGKEFFKKHFWIS